MVQSTLIEIQRKTSLEEIDGDRWNELLSSNATNEPFLTYEWVRCWWDSMAGHRDLYLLVALKDDLLIGIAPLMLSVRKQYLIRQSVLQFIGTGESDYLDFIISPERKEAVLRAFLEHLANAEEHWDAISLTNIPEQSDTVEILENTLGQTGYGFQLQHCFKCPTLLIEKDPSFAIKCTKKKSLKRHFNYFNRSGQLVFQKLYDETAISESLDEFFQQHIERRAIAGNLSKFENQNVRNFYRCLVARFLPAGWLDFSIVKFDDTPIAYHFGFRYFGKFVWYKPTFNVDFENKSPGEVLIKLLLESAIEDGMTEFDFTIGDEPFKRRFANEVRSNIQLEAVRHRGAWLFIRAVNRIREFILTHLPSTSTSIRKYLRLFRQSKHRRKFLAKNARSPFPGATTEARIHHCRKLLFDREEVAFYMIDGNKSAPHQDMPDILVRDGNVTDLRPISSDMSPAHRMKLISRWYFRLKSGERLLVAESLGEPMFYAWVKPTIPERIREALGSRNLSEDSKFIYDFHIMEIHPSNESAAVALYLIAKELQDGPVQTVVVSEQNTPAFSTIAERAGFQPCSTYVRLKLFGLPFSWRNSS